MPALSRRSLPLPGLTITMLTLVSLGVVVLTALIVHLLRRLDRTFKTRPASLAPYCSDPWTVEEIRETYERIAATPIDFTPHLPPRQNRRYVITGGTGFVGTAIARQLLAQGHPASAIRLLSRSKPDPEINPSQADIAHLPWVSADVSSEAAVRQAFDQPWPDKTVASYPLTVFHTAALIRPHERSARHLCRVEPANVRGTNYVLAAARDAGADVLIATGSTSVSVRPIRWFGSVFQQTISEWGQLLADAARPTLDRPRDEFVGNYPYTKALAEKSVLEANAPGFATAVLRCGMGVYGAAGDLSVERALKAGTGIDGKGQPDSIDRNTSSSVSVGHVALAHLLFEKALTEESGKKPAGDKSVRLAGRSLTVTDPGPTPRMGDVFLAIKTLSVTPVTHRSVSPVLLLLVAYVIEAWCAFASILPSFLGIREVPPPAQWLQPPIFSLASPVVVLDDEARKPLGEGGIGYPAVHSTMEGVCQQLVEWNRAHEAVKGEENNGS